MPFTPFHLGPGAAFKAAGGSRFSFLVFGFSQVLIDIEVLVRIIRRDEVLHGYSHTYLGATVVGVVSLVVGKPICELAARAWNAALELTTTGLSQLYLPKKIGWGAAAIAAFAGGYSHIVLDSIMHPDMRPWAPWADGNGLLQFVSVGYLHDLCVLAGALGLAAVIGRAALGRSE